MRGVHPAFTACILTVTAVSAVVIPHIPGKFKDCQERWEAGERKSDVYTIYPNRTAEFPVKVFCNHTDVRAFTVVQRRMYGQINFYTAWQYYKAGFGHSQGDYWAGLDAIYYLTASGNNRLRIDVQDWHGNSGFAEYNFFKIAPENMLYQLSVHGYSSGNIPDDFSYQNGRHFATWDRPDVHNCAPHMKGGWWYNYCAYSLLNGHYYQGGPYSPTAGYYDGIFWKDWRGFGYSLKFTSMSVYT